MSEGDIMIIIPRLRQLYSYYFEKYDIIHDDEVRSFLSDDEFRIFSNMDDYDKLHSFELYKKVKNDPLLKDDMNYLKLALLHDSAKGHVGFWERLKQVVIKKSKISDHAMSAYDNIKDIDHDIAILCKIHHDKTSDEKMKRFQELDE